MHIDEAVKVFRKGIIDFLAKFPCKEYPICSYLFEEADRYFPAGPGFRWDSAHITLDLTTGDLMVHLGTYPVHGRTTESNSSMSAASFAGHAKEAGLSEDCQAFRTKADWAKLFDSELLAALAAAGIEYLPAKASEPKYDPVRIREVHFSDGMLAYHFRYITDLFPSGDKGLPYREMLWAPRVIANLAKHILDLGGKAQDFLIGGGVTELSHTGTLAYRKSYDTFDSFVENSRADFVAAYGQVRQEYGSSIDLEFNYTLVNARINRTDIQVKYSKPVSETIVCFPLKQAAGGIAYIRELVKKFGDERFYSEAGCDELQWDAPTRMIHRTFQLDGRGECLLRTLINTDGRVAGHHLIVQAEDTAQYEFLPEKMDELEKLLAKEMKQAPAYSTTERCAMYLQYHTPQELIALAKEHGLIVE